MDTGKLLKVIEDIQQDEKNFGLQAKFQNILALYTQNTPDVLNTELSSLEKELNKTRLSNYALTDFEILEDLKIETFFGDRTWIELNNILSSQGHEVLKKLTDFTTQRQEAIDKLNTIKNSLNALDIEARELTEKEYEIGFSFPLEYQKLTNFEEVLHDLKLFLVEIATATNQDKEFIISYVSNGTIQIFIQTGEQLAHYFGIALEHALKIYETIQMTEAAKKAYEHLRDDRKKAMDDINDADKEEKSEAIIEELTKQLKIENHENKSNIRILFKLLLKHFENGVSAEVITPTIEKPREPKADDDEETIKHLEEQKALYNSKKQIDLRNKKIFKLQQNKFYGLSSGFLSEGYKKEDKKENE